MRLKALQISFIGEPLDWLWQRIQHLDEQAAPFLQLQRLETNPFVVTLKSYTNLLLTPYNQNDLRALFRHATHLQPQDIVDSLISDVRKLALTQAAQVHWRLADVYDSWPYHFAKLSDPCWSEADRRQLIDNFFKENTCCIDQSCSRKIRALFPHAAAFWADANIQKTLDIWSRRGRLTNMHMERAFALIRKACVQKVPSLERLVAAGFLTQTLSTHLLAGGKHPAVVTRSELQTQCVPIAAAPERPVAFPSRARGHLLYMRDYLCEARLAKGAALSAEEQSTKRREAMLAWSRLSQEEQEVLRVRAENEAHVNDARRAVFLCLVWV